MCRIPPCTHEHESSLASVTSSRREKNIKQTSTKTRHDVSATTVKSIENERNVGKSENSLVKHKQKPIIIKFHTFLGPERNSQARNRNRGS